METTGQYRKSFIILAAIAVAGLVLQMLGGGVDTSLLAWPVSGIVAAVVVLVIAGLVLYREKPFFRRLTGVPFSVSLISAMLLACLVMGLVPQHGMPVGGLLSRAGLYAVTSSWPFVLLYLTLLVTLGCIVANTVAVSGLRRWGFLLNHFGLWLVLFGAGVGSADYVELTLRIDEGRTATHASDRDGRQRAMPFSIGLDDFRMETYPVRWGVIDIRTGKFQPERRPVFHDTEQEAFAAGGHDGRHLLVASTAPEPSFFASDITVGSGGHTESVTVEVNHPYRRGSWTLYQYGYDTAAGEGSRYSIFQLVRDPWLPVVYAGIVLLALGALPLFLSASKKTPAR